MKSTVKKISYLIIMPILVFACTSQNDSLNLNKWMQAVPAHSKFIDKDYYIWGASLVEGDEGKYHLFYSRWKKEYGHNAWVTHSEIAHAVADSPDGPFRHVNVVLPARGAKFWDGLCTHNPTVQKYNGKYYLYYMGNTGDGKLMKTLNWTHRNNQRIGVAVADSPAGPWKRFDKPLIDVGDNKNAMDSLMVSNPSITSMEDGRFLMIYKAVSKQGPAPFGGSVVHLAAISEAPVGPFKKHHKALFIREGEKFPAEDPYIWRQGKQYWAIVKDMKGSFTGAGKSLALFESANGLDWYPSTHPLVSRIEINWKDRGLQKVMHLERPQLWFKNNEPAVLFCAADETRTHSYNVHIPLRSPR